jgi:hypothetical protein
MYRLGDYTAALVERPKPLAEKHGIGAGLVEYLFALAVLTSSRPHDLVLIVTAEKTGGRVRQMAAESGRVQTGNAFLCIFDQSGGHENLGHSADWADRDKFVARALTEAAKRLTIDARPVPIPLKPTAPQPRAAGASSRGRIILVAWLVAVTLAALIVPWKIDYRTGNIATEISRGYAPIWDPPVRAATIDYGKILLEILAITGVAGVLYVLFGRNK